jgi:hypothetical protein
VLNREHDLKSNLESNLQQKLEFNLVDKQRQGLELQVRFERCLIQNVKQVLGFHLEQSMEHSLGQKLRLGLKDNHGLNLESNLD